MEVGRTAVLVLHVDGDAVLLGIGQQLLAAQQVPDSRHGAMILMPGFSA